MIAIFPEITAAVFDTERLCVLVRRYFGGRPAPRFDVADLAAEVGIAIRRTHLERIGALIARDVGGKFDITIIINDRLPEFEARFLTAHLLGHYFIHVTPQIAKGELRIGGYRETMSPLERYVRGGPEDVVETAADEFAAALLMPKGMLAKAYQSLGDVSRLANFFGVTATCAKARLEAAGLIKGERHANFLAAERSLPDHNQKQRGQPVRIQQPVAPAQDLQAATKVPRSVAASSYTKTERETKSTRSEAAQNPQGMSKLRALAKRIDPSVET
jgi:Zn-dependent peptidase ImmA (M78 family)